MKNVYSQAIDRPPNILYTQENLFSHEVVHYPGSDTDSDESEEESDEEEEKGEKEKDDKEDTKESDTQGEQEKQEKDLELEKLLEISKLPVEQLEQTDSVHAKLLLASKRAFDAHGTEEEKKTEAFRNHWVGCPNIITEYGNLNGLKRKPTFINERDSSDESDEELDYDPDVTIIV